MREFICRSKRASERGTTGAGQRLFKSEKDRNEENKVVLFTLMTEAWSGGSARLFPPWTKETESQL